MLVLFINNYIETNNRRQICDWTYFLSMAEMHATDLTRRVHWPWVSETAEIMTRSEDVRRFPLSPASTGRLMDRQQCMLF